MTATSKLSPNEREVRSARSVPAALPIFVAVLLTATALTGCGGGSEESTEPSVSNLAVTNARFSRPAVLNVTGRNLLAGLEVSFGEGCTNVTAVANGTDDSRQFTCDVAAVGEIEARVTTREGRFLGSVKLTVPLPQVTVATSLGAMTLELDAVNAPLSTRNFLNYVASGFYRNTLVHQAIPDRGILAGGFNSGLVPKPANRLPIALESDNGLKNLRGTIGVVREAEVDSGSSQWYVNARDNPDLDFIDVARPGYAVFGRVTAGLSVVDAITAVPTRADARTGFTNVPVTQIFITATAQTR